MPKNRKRVVKGAKSVAIRTKHKIHGRKSGQGVKQMTVLGLQAVQLNRPRDRNKIDRELTLRGALLPS